MVTAFGLRVGSIRAMARNHCKSVRGEGLGTPLTACRALGRQAEFREPGAMGHGSATGSPPGCSGPQSPGTLKKVVSPDRNHLQLHSNMIIIPV